MLMPENGVFVTIEVGQSQGAQRYDLIGSSDLATYSNSQTTSLRRQLISELPSIILVAV